MLSSRLTVQPQPNTGVVAAAAVKSDAGASTYPGGVLPAASSSPGHEGDTPQPYTAAAAPRLSAGYVPAAAPTGVTANPRSCTDADPAVPERGSEARRGRLAPPMTPREHDQQPSPPRGTWLLDAPSG